MTIRSLFATTALSAGLLFGGLATPAMAHCDSMDGPVVADARRALAARDIAPVLKWIPAADETEVRTAFDMTLAVRGESDTARAVADRYFYETLIRVHRAGEGESFTGLKPAGSVAPAIAAADRALADGQVQALADHLADEIRGAVQSRFADAYALRQSADDSVEQGRAYVAAYVQFTHFAEQAAHLVDGGASHQHRDAEANAAH